MPAFGSKMVTSFKTYIVLGVAVFALLAGALMTAPSTVHAAPDNDIEAVSYTHLTLPTIYSV